MNYKEEVCRFSHLAELKGLANAMEGNLSVLDRETGLMYITPSGKCKYYLEPEEVAVLDKDRNQVEGDFKASSEYRLHDAIYKVRPDVNAVVHSHAPYLTAYAMCGKSFSFDECPEVALTCKEVKVLPFATPGTPEVAEGIGEAISDRNVVLLCNHGVVACGYNLEQALRFLEGAERAARLKSLTLQIGEPLPLPEDVLQNCKNTDILQDKFNPYK